MQKSNRFQILTKRAGRLPDFKYPDNVWLGVTVETAKYKSRMYYLKQTNAKVKFLSCEPLLEDLGELDLSGIDWVIVGGESGAKARPMHPDWVRNIQREAQKVPFFFKQWGEWKQGKLIDEDFAHKHFHTAVVGDKTVILNVPIEKQPDVIKLVKNMQAVCLLARNIRNIRRNSKRTKSGMRGAKLSTTECRQRQHRA